MSHYLNGSLNAFVKSTRLVEGQQADNAMQMVQSLPDDHETILRAVRLNVNEVADTYKDAGTANFQPWVMEQHEKMAWMLCAHLG